MMAPTPGVQDVVQVAPLQPPVITRGDIWRQVWTDIAGKEVQTAESSSHSWVANQFGHLCLGILFSSLLGIVFVWWFGFPLGIISACALVAFGVSAWEWWAYRTAVQDAIGHQFPLGRKLLRKNAIDAAAYMLLGVVIAFVYRFFSLNAADHFLRLGYRWWGLIIYALIAFEGVRRARFWLRQKITWQKAGLPFLFRLADAQPIQDPIDAKNLQSLLDRKPSPGTANQIVIGGPISSGRTDLCAGIGTEFAFRDASVRYLGLAALLEFAARSKHSDFPDDPGPKNIQYWPWSTAQVVIIDDVWPLLTGNAQNASALADHFQAILDQLNPIRQVLTRCHTVWVLGDAQRSGQISQNTLDDFARLITEFCMSQSDRTLVIELEGVQAPAKRAPRVRRANYL